MIQKIIRHCVVSLLLFSCYQYGAESAQPLEFQITAKQHAKIKLLLMIVGDVPGQMTEFASVMKKDLEFSGQFSVIMRTCSAISAKAEMLSLYKEGFPLALFINEATTAQALEWRLYDTQCAMMLKGKKYHKRGELARGWAHNIADLLWPELTAQEGFFSTKIAYCKEVVGSKGRRLKHIYIADYDGSNAQALVTTPTINVAPRFNYDLNNPLLFYSENTHSNVRLMLADMHRKSKVASNFDGVNMLPSFSKDGSCLVYCASRGDGNCQLYYYEKNKLKQITHNTGNNVSPSLSEDGRLLFFCSDYQNGKPQIYCHNLITGLERTITESTDACYCPVYNSKKGLLAYSKMTKGTMQIFVYTEKTGMHRQITFDAGNKDECSWSPCGNYLLFGIEQGRTGQIAMLNVMTKERHMVSAKNDICSYPTWSPRYTHYPCVA